METIFASSTNEDPSSAFTCRTQHEAPMDRKDFIRKSLLGTGMLVSGTAAAQLMQNDIDEIKPLDPVGFDHLPPTPPERMGNMVLHRASERGTADHGWLKANFSFSFANWYDPTRMHFGVLRVMNDDIIAAGKGFGTHPHDNMEIITIPLKGALQHTDSMGNTSIINAGDVQVMSAGTGILHSEFNPYNDRDANTLQIWLFPNKRQVKPRYQQMTLDPKDRVNDGSSCSRRAPMTPGCGSIRMRGSISAPSMRAGRPTTA